MIHTIHGLKNEDPLIIEMLFKLGKKIAFEEPHLAKNYSPLNYENNPSSLFYLLDIEQRFAKGSGEFFVHVHEQKIICIHGLYFNTDFQKIILLTRLYKASENRNSLMARFLDIELFRAKELGYKTALITVNIKNEELINKFSVFLNRKKVVFSITHGFVKFAEQAIFEVNVV